MIPLDLKVASVWSVDPHDPARRTPSEEGKR